MKRLDAPLITPVYAKTSPQAAWPEDEAFYLLASSGMFFCRNTEFFRSVLRARRAPTELALQDESLILNFPRLSAQALEQSVGFFDWAFQERGAEAVLLLAWDERRQEIELIAPPQEAVNYRSQNGQVWAESVRYEFPHPLRDGITIFGDCHSHCEMSAYASAQDQRDEELFNGLHIVVGRIDQEPPQWHIEVSIDGARVSVDPTTVFEGYSRRDHRFPQEWRAQHTVRYTGYELFSSGTSGMHGSDLNRYHSSPTRRLLPSDDRDYPEART